MKKKTYADICLERAERATEGPWDVTSDLPSWAVASLKAQTDVVGTLNRAYRIPFRKNLGCELNDAEFIAHARTDVPELARRLTEACRILRLTSHNKGFSGLKDLADELEKDIENE